MSRLIGVVGFAVAWQCITGVASAESRSPLAIVSLGEIRGGTVRPGDSLSVVIPVTIADGYHVQANPASSEFLIPLQLDVAPEEPDSLLAWTPVYPPPGTLRLQGATEELLTYHGSIGVELRIIPSARARPGERRFKGTLTYQACDANRCLFPASVPVTLHVHVSDGKASH